MGKAECDKVKAFLLDERFLMREMKFNLIDNVIKFMDRDIVGRKWNFQLFRQVLIRK